MAYGKIPESDKTPYHRRLEKQFNIDFSNMKPRTWLIEGQTIVSPEFKQQGKPYIINRALRAKYQQQQTQPKPSLTERFKRWMDGKNFKQPTEEEIQDSEEQSEEDKEDEIEQAQGDGLMEFNEPMFPEEIE